MTGDEVDKNNMVFGAISDLEMASKVRMLMRYDLDHEPVCMGARDRIMYLSQENKRLKYYINTIANMTYEGELIDDGEFYVMDSVDTVTTLSQLIRKAREFCE